jgi:hypothetical protein
MPKRRAGPTLVKGADENETGISVLDLTERQLDLDTDEPGSLSDSEQGFSDDDDDGTTNTAHGQEASDDDTGTGDEVGKAVFDLMQGPHAAAGALGEEEVPQAGTSDALSDSDSSEDERPSRNTGHCTPNSTSPNFKE